MRAIVFLMLAALVLPTFGFTPPADAAGPVAPTLYGPTFIPAARNWSYSGQLVVDGPGTPAPLYGQTIGMYLGGVRVAETETDLQGKYLVRFFIPRGTHSLEARAFEGAAAESGSNILQVHAYPTWPDAPANLRVEPGFYYTEANVTWRYPPSDGGYPVTSYRLDRSANGGPFATVFAGNALEYQDPDVTPGSVYTYHAYATTSYATSNKTPLTYTANDIVALVDLVSYKVCAAAGCANVSDGGSFTASPDENVTIEVNVTGVVDRYPVAPPGLTGHTVHGRITLPATAGNFTRTSGAAGVWNATVGTFWATAPASGCASVPIVAHARPIDQGRSEDVGALELCV